MFFNNTTGSKSRLKDISHHFLGNSGKKVNTSSPVVFLPVLLESYLQDSFVYGTNNYFNSHNRSTVVINVDKALKESIPVEKKSDLEMTNQSETNRKRIFKHVCNLETVPDLCLLPFVSSEVKLLHDNDFLLVVVPASLNGVRKSFHNIEELCKDFENVTIGVVVVNANSLQMSQLCFDVISNSLESFLGLKSVLLGHLLSDTAIDLTKGRVILFPDDVNKLNSAPIELDDIAENIWSKLASYIHNNKATNNLNPDSNSSPEDSADFRTLSA